ncbi:MAG: pimeloyl-ACP methyl ester carboxylesterase [Gammaproteobacteria bacterium]|jgi:pimeloyl-ACP methyl ester carboxylesterase
MSTYLLVHGSFQGAWVWRPTAELLRQAGHCVHVPTLDGCAERKASLRFGISVTSAAQELAELMFYEDLSDVIVVGTSSGGLVVQKLAELARNRIQRLVFVDALVPGPGESVADIVQRPPGATPYEFTELARGPGPDALREGLFADFPPDLKAWAVDRATLHPIGLSDQGAGELDEFWAQDWNVTVIRCKQSPNPPEAHQRGTAKRLNGTWLEVDSGHYPMLTHPVVTAELLQHD